MKLLVAIAGLFSLMPYVAYAASSTQTFATSAGAVRITPLVHASTLIEAGGKAIYVDPAKPAKLDGAPKADLILITDIHPDHMDPAADGQISKSGTEIMAPPAVVATVTTAKPIANGETKSWQGWTIEAIPAYNLTRGPAPGKLYSRQGSRQWICAHLWRQALLLFGRYRRRAGDARSEEYRCGFCVHEFAVHHASRRGG